jgi:hypothetical protein
MRHMDLMYFATVLSRMEDNRYAIMSNIVQEILTDPDFGSVDIPQEIIDFLAENSMFLPSEPVLYSNADRIQLIFRYLLLPLMRRANIKYIPSLMYNYPITAVLYVKFDLIGDIIDAVNEINNSSPNTFVESDPILRTNMLQNFQLIAGNLFNTGSFKKFRAPYTGTIIDSNGDLGTFIMYGFLTDLMKFGNLTETLADHPSGYRTFVHSQIITHGTNSLSIQIKPEIYGNTAQNMITVPTQSPSASFTTTYEIMSIADVYQIIRHIFAPTMISNVLTGSGTSTDYNASQTIIIPPVISITRLTSEINVVLNPTNIRHLVIASDALREIIYKNIYYMLDVEGEDVNNFKLGANTADQNNTAAVSYSIFDDATAIPKQQARLAWWIRCIRDDELPLSTSLDPTTKHCRNK